MKNRFEEIITNMPNVGLNVLLGTDGSGKLTYTNLAKTGHIAIASNTDESKAVMHTMICSMICKTSENTCSIVLISLDNKQFSVYEERPEVSIASNIDEALGWLNTCSQICDVRRDSFSNRACSNISELNDPFTLPIVVFIDDLNELLGRNKKAERFIVELLRNAATYGIHLVFGYRFAKTEFGKTNIERLVPARIMWKEGMKFVRNGMTDPVCIEEISISDDIKKAAALAATDSRSRGLSLQNQILRQHAKDLTKDFAYERQLSEEQERREQYEKELAKASKPRRMGLFRTMWALWNVKPIMFVSDEYPIRIK